MYDTLLQHLGWFIVPQTVLSVVTTALVVGYLLAWSKGNLGLEPRPWIRTLDPLAAIAVSVGLFGSVWGFISAFEGFTGGIDVGRVTSGLAVGYWTTLVGLTTSLIAACGCYTLDLLDSGGLGRSR